MAGELVFITGATGFVGFAVLVQALKANYRVRISVRSSSQIEQIKHHPLITPFLPKVEFVVVPDITADGAFDSALDGVIFVEHVASPLPKPTEDPENDIILPAIHGTTSILNSALKFPSIRRVVITSSIVGIMSNRTASNGDTSIVYTPDVRVSPLPTAPWGPASSAYRASKALALVATDKFIAEKKPHFTIVNLMPGYVIGRNDLAADVKSLAAGSNGLFLAIVLGLAQPGDKRPCMVTNVRDVARVHVEALDGNKVKGSASFLLDAGRIEFDDAKEIVRRNFPKVVEDGTFPLSGSVGSALMDIDSSATKAVFGEMATYEDAIKSLLGQYLELKSKA